MVFQHWNVAYFEAILSAAEKEGAELKAAVSQVGDPIWSMHKKKNKESVLSGELILTFQKNQISRKTHNKGNFDLFDEIDRILSMNSYNHIYGEYLFNKLVVEAWNKSAISSLRSISREDFRKLLEIFNWHYDSENHYWVRDKRCEPSLFDSV